MSAGHLGSASGLRQRVINPLETQFQAHIIPLETRFQIYKILENIKGRFENQNVSTLLIIEIININSKFRKNSVTAAIYLYQAYFPFLK